jgi:hypothetical protein
LATSISSSFGKNIDIYINKWHNSVPGNAGVSVRGSRSILQGFQRVGSNFLPLGTPLPARLLEELRKGLINQAIERHFPNCLLSALRPKYK